MQNEIWKKLILDRELSGKYYIDKVIDADTFKIYLSDDDGKRIKLIWDGIIESYTCSDEVNRNKLYEMPNLTEWSFFEIDNSNYIKWLFNESEGILNQDKLHHICIVGINSVVDIISSLYPDAVIINK